MFYVCVSLLVEDDKVIVYFNVIVDILFNKWFLINICIYYMIIFILFCYGNRYINLYDWFVLVK